jgi:hypothetical protein
MMIIMMLMSPLTHSRTCCIQLFILGIYCIKLAYNINPQQGGKDGGKKLHVVIDVIEGIELSI